MEVEVRMISKSQEMPKVATSLQKLEEQGLVQSVRRDYDPADVSILDFWPLELCENKFMLFSATEFVVICQADLQRLIYCYTKFQYLMTQHNACSLFIYISQCIVWAGERVCFTQSFTDLCSSHCVTMLFSRSSSSYLCKKEERAYIIT